MNIWEGIQLCLVDKDRWMLILQGLGTTLLIALGAILIGTAIGAVMALCRISDNKLLRGISGVYVTVVRGIPMVTQLMIFAYIIFASVRETTLVAVIAFGINSGAYMTEIMRGGIQSVDKGQMEAGRSLGLSRWQTRLRIIFPQAARNVLPTYTSEFITLIKETSVVGYVAVTDLTKAADAIRNATYNAWVPLLTAAVIYLILTIGLTKAFGLLERRMARSDRS